VGPEERFSDLADLFVGGPDVGLPGEPGTGGDSSALQIEGSIFAMLTRDHRVVKLPRDQVAEQLADDTDTPFDAGKGRPLKEWPTVETDDEQMWRSSPGDACPSPARRRSDRAGDLRRPHHRIGDRSVREGRPRRLRGSGAPARSGPFQLGEHGADTPGTHDKGPGLEPPHGVSEHGPDGPDRSRRGMRQDVGTGRDVDAPAAPTLRPAGTGPRRRIRHWTATLVAAGVVLSGCSLHISKHGVSGNILGHSFSGASGALPAGFPTDVPQPASSRVLAGGGTDGRWDVAFAVTGTISSGTMAYHDELAAAGYGVSDVQTGSAPDVGSSGRQSDAPSTTVTITAYTFDAKGARWNIKVEAGTSTSSTAGLKSGEFPLNITVVPTSSPSTTTP